MKDESRKESDMNVEQLSDQACYQLLSTRQPSALDELRSALAMGATAAGIERGLFAKLGPASLTAAVFAGAAHYIENQQKEQLR